jgi:hypothetical protein
VLPGFFHESPRSRKIAGAFLFLAAANAAVCKAARWCCNDAGKKEGGQQSWPREKSRRARGQEIKQSGPPDRQAPDCFPPSEIRRPCCVGWHLLFRSSALYNFRKVWRLLGLLGMFRRRPAQSPGIEVPYRAKFRQLNYKALFVGDTTRAVAQASRTSVSLFHLLWSPQTTSSGRFG